MNVSIVTVRNLHLKMQIPCGVCWSFAFEQGNLKEVDERREATDDWLKYCGFADFAASLAQVVPVLFFRRKFVGWWLTVNRTIPFHVALCYHLGQMWIYDCDSNPKASKPIKQYPQAGSNGYVWKLVIYILIGKHPTKTLGKSWFTSGFPCPTSVTARDGLLTGRCWTVMAMAPLPWS